jgi:hypothetical protein
MVLTMRLGTTDWLVCVWLCAGSAALERTIEAATIAMGRIVRTTEENMAILLKSERRKSMRRDRLR